MLVTRMCDRLTAENKFVPDKPHKRTKTFQESRLDIVECALILSVFS